MRVVGLLAFGFLAGLIVLIYDMKYETRRLEAKAQQLARAIEDEKDNVALMRAEWSHVARPERIEKLAREILDLQPIKAGQIIRHHDFQEVLARRPVPDGTDGVTGWRPRDEIGALIRDSGENGHAQPSATQ